MSVWVLNTSALFSIYGAPTRDPVARTILEDEFYVLHYDGTFF
jgi:hypothetical protein